MSDFQHETNTELPAVGAPTEPEYAGFWRRVAAHFIDGVVMSLTMLAIVLVTIGNNSLYILTLIVPGVLSIIYQLYFTTQYGASLGKMAMGIKIVRLDGGPIGFSQANLRYLPFLIFAVVGILGNVEAFQNIPIPSIFFEYGWTERAKILQQQQPIWILFNSLISGLFIVADTIALLISKQKLSIHDRIANTMVIKIETTTD